MTLSVAVKMRVCAYLNQLSKLLKQLFLFFIGFLEGLFIAVVKAFLAEGREMAGAGQFRPDNPSPLCLRGLSPMMVLLITSAMNSIGDLIAFYNLGRRRRVGYHLGI